MERNLRKWEGNSRMFKRLLKAIKSKFQLKTKFHIYDPNDQMYVDDIDDLCGCYIGFENDPDFVLNLDIKVNLLFIHSLTHSLSHSIESIHHSFSHLIIEFVAKN